jgi:hypothetical protein
VSSGGGAQAAPQRWQLGVAGLQLTIERLPGGRWLALYGGFSRAASDRLSDAIVVAAGANSHDPWVSEIARRVEAGLRSLEDPVRTG